MRCIGLVLCSALLVLGASKPAPKPVDNIAWGEPVLGVRIGLAFGPATPEPQIRLIFQNMSKQEILIPVGSESAKGPVYDVQFMVVSPKGEESPVFNFNGPAGVQPAPKPVILDIPKGGKQEIVLSMKKLLYLDNGKNRPLTDMLAQHYAVHAVLDTSGDARWSRLINQWLGKMTTGDLKQP